MSTSPEPNYKKINATHLVDNFTLLDGVSQKTGNSYLLPTLELKSPISDTPIRLEFKYVDPNTTGLIKMALEKYASEQLQEFQQQD